MQNEFNNLNNYSGNLISSNFNNIETDLSYIYKSIDGYSPIEL